MIPAVTKPPIPPPMIATFFPDGEGGEGGERREKLASKKRGRKRYCAIRKLTRIVVSE